ncbi:PREDICTED: astacin-like metalloprotease toxin 1 [Acropora digitifera]|nr:PREDICTED: astacin-like metalloprotease toxin 1 [Acropora digitifera]
MDRISEANKPFNIGHEGDIALTERDGNVYEKSRVRRNAVRQRKKVWPNRVIPYEMEEGLDLYKDNIMAAIEEFHKHTCIKFKVRTNERNWIKFRKDKG